MIVHVLLSESKGGLYTFEAPLVIRKVKGKSDVTMQMMTNTFNLEYQRIQAYTYTAKQF